MSAPCLHIAPWLVPIASPPLVNGGLVVEDDCILAIGSAAELRRQFPGIEQEHHNDQVLLPALVNAHTHLELSHLGHLSEGNCPESFTWWINQLITERVTWGADGELALQAAQNLCGEQYQQGVSVIADIGNTAIGAQLKLDFKGPFLAFKEYLGLASWTLEKNLERLQQEPDDALCTGHAPYSTHPVLLQHLKQRARDLGQLFSIHTAEPAAEAALLGQQCGELVDFVRDRGFWDQTIFSRSYPGTISYLQALGLLDEHTLCVHAIHVSEDEIRLMADKGVQVCLCPGSNRFLGTGKAPVAKYLQHGMLPALGTDSLASNPSLSLWREIRFLHEDHPELAPATLLSMATLGGARALQVETQYGSLAPGKIADILAVAVPPELQSIDQVLAHLVYSGPKESPERIKRF